MFGLLRGRYRSPVFAIKLGESAIRNCFRDQLAAIKKEGRDYMGNHPCVFTEIGIPYDMDGKHAYKTGDFSSQIAAMDANHYALEGSSANGYSLWVYMTKVLSRPLSLAWCMLLIVRRTTTSGVTFGTGRICPSSLSTICHCPPHSVQALASRLLRIPRQRRLINPRLLIPKVTHQNRLWSLQRI